MLQGPFVCIFSFVLIYKLAGKPVIISTGRVGAFIKFFLPIRLCLAADFYSIYFLKIQFGNIYVQHYSFWHSVLKCLLGNFFYKLFSRVEIRFMGKIQERKSDSGN